MSFLNVAALWGLFAVSIPILIHLFNLKKVKKVEFSTLMFLKELQRSKLRRIKLKQLLLLACRILIIAFAVLAFAKPVINSFSAGNSSATKTALIFVDDSFSMNIKNANGTYLDQAKTYVNNILVNYKETDNVYLIPASNIYLKDKNFVYSNFKDLNDNLAGINYSYVKTDFPAMMNFANEILGSTSTLTNDIFIISDFQNVNFSSFIDQGFNNKFKSANIYLLNFDRRQANNLSVENLKFSSPVIEKGSSIKLKVDLRNNSNIDVKNKLINLYLNGEKVSERYADVTSGSAQTVEISFPVNQSGINAGYLELVQDNFSEDELKEDNLVYFTLDVPESYSFLIYEQEPGSGKYAELVLNSVNQLGQDSIKNSYAVNFTRSGSLNQNLNNFDAVILTGLNNISEADANALYDFTLKGGGVFIFPGNTPDLDNLNSLLFSRLNNVKLNREINGYPELKFEKLNYQHPALIGIFKEESNQIESPAITKFYEILKSENSNSLITLNNQKDFLVESINGEGRVFISAVPADLVKSNFVMNPIFAPLIMRSLLYLSSEENPNAYFEVGKVNIIPAASSYSQFIIKSPGQESLNINNSSGSDYLMIPFTKETGIIGNYQVLDSANKMINEFALNKNSVESNLSFADENSIENYFNNAGIENITSVNELDAVSFKIQQAGTGMELWSYFLILALLLIGVEYFLSKNIEEN